MLSAMIPGVQREICNELFSDYVKKQNCNIIICTIVKYVLYMV